MKRWRVAVVGGGITGLSTAFYLQQEARNKSIPLDIVLTEASERLGGKIQTERTDGFVMEKGPDSFLERKSSAKQLAMDLGLEDELVRNRTGQAYILHQGKLFSIPEGAVMGIPTRLTPFLRTALFSPAGKLRAARDLVLSRSQAKEDQSVGSFFRRRLGDEVVDQLIEPLLSGIYAGSLDQLSLEATFPQFARLEEEHRSLILGMKRTRPPQSGTKRKQGQFLTLRRGLSRLVEAIEQTLPKESVITGNPLTRIIPEGSRYLLVLASNRVVQADAVVMALPFDQMEPILPASLPPRPNPVPATSVATVIMGFDADSLPHSPDGTGFVVPRREPTWITACTWTHKKWPHTVPEGKAMVRCYVGRQGQEELLDESDDALLEKVRTDLKKIQGIDTPPLFYRVTRWKQAMPQYTVGHVQWREQVEQTCRNTIPGVFPCGASFGGIGIPDCIDQGKQAVRDVLAYLNLKQRTS